MRKKVILFLVAMISVYFLHGQDDSNVKYLKLSYIKGHYERFIPDVAISPKEMKNFESNGIAYKVSEQDFEAILRYIETNKNLVRVDTAKLGYYEFTFVDEVKIARYFVNTSDELRIVFRDMIAGMNNPKKQKKIKEGLDAVLKSILQIE